MIAREKYEEKVSKLKEELRLRDEEARVKFNEDS